MPPPGTTTILTVGQSGNGGHYNGSDLCRDKSSRYWLLDGTFVNTRSLVENTGIAYSPLFPVSPSIPGTKVLMAEMRSFDNTISYPVDTKLQKIIDNANDDQNTILHWNYALDSNGNRVYGFRCFNTNMMLQEFGNPLSAQLGIFKLVLTIQPLIPGNETPTDIVPQFTTFASSYASAIAIADGGSGFNHSFKFQNKDGSYAQSRIYLENSDSHNVIMPAEFKNIVIDNAILTNVEYSASKDVTAALQSAFTSAQAGITGTADKTGLITYWTCTNGIKLFIIDTGRFNAAFGDISFGIQKTMQFDFHYTK